MHRFFIDSETLHAGDIVSLPEEEARHAAKVLRLGVGDVVELFDGDGSLYEGVVKEAGKKSARVEITKKDHSEREAVFVGIAFCPPKGKRTLLAVEQMTELGVDCLVPLKSERSVAGGGGLEKWHQRAIEASKQCKRLYLPEVKNTSTVAEIVEAFSEWDNVFVASLAEDLLEKKEVISRIKKSKRVLWLIGPEGGFTEEEEILMVERGAKRVCFSGNVLRIATAAAFSIGITRFFA